MQSKPDILRDTFPTLVPVSSFSLLRCFPLSWLPRLINVFIRHGSPVCWEFTPYLHGRKPGNLRWQLCNCHFSEWGRGRKEVRCNQNTVWRVAPQHRKKHSLMLQNSTGSCKPTAENHSVVNSEGPDIQWGIPTVDGAAGSEDETIVAWNLWGPRLLMKWHFPPRPYNTSTKYLSCPCFSATRSYLPIIRVLIN